MSIDLTAPEVKQAIEAEVEKITGPLKTKNTELLDEVKDLKRKFDGVDPAEFKQLKQKAQQSSDDEVKDAKEFRSRIEAEFAPKLEEERNKRIEAENKLNERTIDSELTSALSAAGVKDLLDGAKAFIRSSRKVEVTDGGATVDGLPVKDFVQKWAADAGKVYIAAADNAGGGASGSRSGGASSGKKTTEMSTAEKTAFIKENGQQAWTELVQKG